MRIVLFDWTSGGHHALYLERFAQALGPENDVVVCAPDETAERLGAHGLETYGLGAPRPALDPGRRAGPQNAELAAAELDLLERAAGATRPDRLVHLYADPVLRRLVERPPLPVPTSVLFFFPRSHYPRCFGTPLPPRERARGLFHDRVVARWRRRRDAASVLTLDPVAAERWSRRRGAPVHWVGEPPLPADLPRVPAGERAGVVLYGALAARKGVDLLTEAMAIAPGGRLTLAGGVEEGFADDLDRYVGRMSKTGTDVDLRGWHQPEAEGLGAIAGARAAVLPYPAHYGMSRVLLEAAGVGTPVVAHDRGLIGHLVREHGLGVTVDCTDARAFRDAIDSLADDPGAVERHAPALAAFAETYSVPAFRGRVRRALDVPAPVPAAAS